MVCNRMLTAEVKRGGQFWIYFNIYNRGMVNSKVGCTIKNKKIRIEA